jgi:hypothetical protein
MNGTAPRRHPVGVDGERAEIGDAAELAVAVELLGPGRSGEVLAQLAPDLPAILGGPEGLLQTVRALDPADRPLLFSLLGEALPPLVRGARRLGELLALTAAPAVEEQLLRALGPAVLRSYAGNARDLAEMLQWVYGECDRLLLELLGAEHLGAVLGSAADLAHALHALDPGGQRRLLELLGPGHAARLVADARDLARVLHALPRDAARELLDGFTPEELVARIGGEREWRRLCRRLADDEAQLLFARLGVHRAP